MARKTSQYTDSQRALIADIGRAAALMGLTQEDAAKRATEVLGVNVSQSSVSRAVLAEPAVAAVAKDEPETLFDFANLTAAESICTKLDTIIAIMRGNDAEKKRNYKPSRPWYEVEAEE